MVARASDRISPAVVNRVKKGLASKTSVTDVLATIGALTVTVGAIFAVGWLADRYPWLKTAGMLFAGVLAIGSLLYLVAPAILAIFGAEDAIIWDP